jgi:hypothetical protein
VTGCFPDFRGNDLLHILLIILINIVEGYRFFDIFADQTASGKEYAENQNQT